MKDDVENDLTAEDVERRLEEVVHILHQADARILRQLLKEKEGRCSKNESCIIPKGQHRGSSP